MLYMNYKMQDKQNQLIERISDKHLIVGIDIAQNLHVARAVNYRGIVIGDPITFENDKIGFTKLKVWMNKLKISESGIHTIDDIKYLQGFGFNGFLIGENFMKQENPGEAFRLFAEELTRVKA